VAGRAPAGGRYREFTQADIDVVGRGSLSLHFDAEMPVLVHEVMTALPDVPPVTIRVNNRKLVEGVMRWVGLEDDVAPAMRVLDKLDKRGPERVAADLSDAGVPDGAAAKLLAAASIRGGLDDVVAALRELGAEGEVFEEGLDELRFVLEAAEGRPVVADLSIVRGLDYYTGTVYETTMDGHESVGAVCSGGRYDNLVEGGRDKLPGVGVSIGVTRILGRLFGRTRCRSGRRRRRRSSSRSPRRRSGSGRARSRPACARAASPPRSSTSR
jgi:histidyl-tRNA synthetase